MHECLLNLKNKYNYDDQMLQTISKVIEAFINVLGEEYTDIILGAVNNTFIFQFDNSMNATNRLNEIINDGTNYYVSNKAEGGGVMEDYYTYNNGKIYQNFAIGISIIGQKKLQTLVHELCHVISTYGKLKIEDNKVIIRKGLNFASYQLIDGKIGDRVSNEGEIFNEMLTENLSMQIMDYLEPEVIHEPAAYNGYVNDFKGIFRNNELNKVLINDYINSSSNFLFALENIISKEQILNEIDNLYHYFDDSNERIITYLDYLKTLSVRDFFSVYIEYCNRFTKTPEGVDKETFKQMKAINSEIIYNVSQKLVKNNYSR